MRRSLKVRLVVVAAVAAAGAFGVAYATAAVTGGGSGGTVVNCGAGKSLQQAIDKSSLTKPLVLTIEGTCNESVTIHRDDVTLNASSGAGIHPPSGDALTLVGAGRIQLNGLTLTGGGLTAFRDSSVVASQLHVNNASNVGVSMDFGSTGLLNNSVVDNAGNDDIQANTGGSIAIDGGTISNSAGSGIAAAGGTVELYGGAVVSGNANFGVFAAPGGSIDVAGATIESSGQDGVHSQDGSITMNGSVVVENNEGFGIAANNNGFVDLTGDVQVTGNTQGGVIVFESGALQTQGAPTIENNTGNGVSLDVSSTAQIADTTISGNTGAGVQLSDTSVAAFDGSDTVTDNGGWGVHCEGPPATAVITGTVGTVSGNTNGQNNCPTA